MFKYKTRINFCKFVSGILAPYYLGFWVQYHNRSLENHKHWFCLDDLSYCISGTLWKFIVVKLVVPIVWPIQKGINLIQNEIIILKEAWFSFDHLHKSNAWSLFSSQSSCSSNSHVPIVVSCPSFVRIFDASCWPTTCGGKKVRWPLVFKMIQQHINNWEAGILLFKCIVFPIVDGPPTWVWMNLEYSFKWQVI